MSNSNERWETLINEKKTFRTIETIGPSKLCMPLPPVNYLVPALGIGVGAPAMFAGYGFTGKTAVAQDLALSVASGTDFLGLYRARKGRVLHLDFEQGARITTDRYQRLAKGKGVDLASLADDALRVGVFPVVRLSDQDAEEVLSAAFEGIALVVIDSLRACAPGVDENSSEVREVLDQVNRACEKSGTTALFVHHARKPKEGDGGNATFAIRGSSGIFDACGSVFVFEGFKGGPSTVRHQKCRNRGTLVDDFGFSVEDVEFNGDNRAGLRVRHLDTAQMVELKPKDIGFGNSTKTVADFMKNASEYRGSKTGIGKRLAMRGSVFYAAFAELESEGIIEVGKDEKGKFVRWIGEEAAQ
jgi:hypothetical protein